MYTYIYVCVCVGYKARDEMFSIRNAVNTSTHEGASGMRFILKMLSLRLISYLYHNLPFSLSQAWCKYTMFARNFMLCSATSTSQ